MFQEKSLNQYRNEWEDVPLDNERRKEIGYLFDFLCREKQKLDEVFAFEEEMVNFKNLHKLIDFVVFNVCKILEAGRCSLMLVDADGRQLVVRGAIGLSEDFIINNVVYVGEGVAGYVAQTREALVVADINSDERFSRNNRESYESCSFMSVPIILGGQLIGILNVADKIAGETDVFTDFDLKLLKSMARQSAFAIENSKLHRSLECLAIIDPITHLHNRRYLTETLEHEMQSALRSTQSLCLMLLDINQFKNFNRDFGDKEGDHLLRKIAKLMVSHLSKLNVVCRYSSDEFAVIMPYTDEKSAVEAATKIIEAIEMQFPISVSVGIAQYSPMMRTYDLLRKTSLALVQAQRSFNLKTVFYA